MDYLIEPSELLQRGLDLRQAYAEAAPFPHIVLDDFFPEGVVAAALEEFPAARDADWQSFESGQERKLASNNERALSPTARRIIWEMNSQVFLEFLENLTGISDLIPDPKLSGGGMHQIERGGKLGVHVDFNRHVEFGLDRRLNVLLYLNREWREDYGGHLELWDQDMKSCVQRVAPVFNRLVVFSTTDTSWHGHPDPLACPEEVTRKSLALYYYTNGRPELERSDEHTTVFAPRPGERLQRERPALRLRDFVPPVLMRGLDRVRGR